MKVFEDEGKGLIYIDDVTIAGHIDEQKCKVCGYNEIYYDTYDALFCPNCNKWKENTCKDPDCIYCSGRPKKPLP